LLSSLPFALPLPLPPLLLIVDCCLCPAIDVAAGVFIATAAAHGGSLAVVAAVAAVATAAALLPLAQQMSGQRW
jgi:hypothetical protein